MVSNHGPSCWDRCIERVLKESRMSAQDHVYDGDHFKHGFPFAIPNPDIGPLTLVFGLPGSDETVLSVQQMMQLVDAGYTVISVDCKGVCPPIHLWMSPNPSPADTQGASDHEQ